MEYLQLMKLSKDETIIQAKNHHNLMVQQYSLEIDRAIKHTQIYTDNSFNTDTKIDNVHNVTFELVSTDTISTLYNSPINMTSTLVINFASFTEPGGRFLQGSHAQEESIAHESILYEVLSSFNSYYEENSKYKNRGLYINRALFSPYILIERNSLCLETNVLTVAAPNKKVLQYSPDMFTEEENTKALIDRIKFIKNICEDKNIKYLVAGAFGCGVFHQNPYEVAKLFIKIFSQSSCIKVIFAIPLGNNYDAFYSVLNDYMKYKYDNKSLQSFSVK